jgi:putative flippase GtrA
VLKTFLKFISVGALNALIYFSLMYLLTSIIGIWYMASAMISVVIQTLITFGLHRIYTWKSKKVAIKSVITIWRFIKYVIVGIGGMIFGLVLLYIITEYIHIWYGISVFVASFILLILNFIANNYWTWGEDESQELKWIVFLINRLGFTPIVKRLGVEI